MYEIAILALLYLLGRKGPAGGTSVGGLFGTPKPKPKPGGVGGFLGPAGGRPAGDPPGGCAKHYTEGEAENILVGLNYNPQPGVFGPDGQLGTWDAAPDTEIQRFQGDYNRASAAGKIGANAGGLDADGFMGKCTMAAMKHAYDNYGPTTWPGIAGGQ